MKEKNRTIQLPFLGPMEHSSEEDKEFEEEMAAQDDMNIHNILEGEALENYIKNNLKEHS